MPVLNSYCHHLVIINRWVIVGPDRVLITVSVCISFTMWHYLSRNSTTFDSQHLWSFFHFISIIVLYRHNTFCHILSTSHLLLVGTDHVGITSAGNDLHDLIRLCLYCSYSFPVLLHYMLPLLKVAIFLTPVVFLIISFTQDASLTIKTKNCRITFFSSMVSLLLSCKCYYNWPKIMYRFLV